MYLDVHIFDCIPITSALLKKKKKKINDTLKSCGFSYQYPSFKKNKKKKQKQIRTSIIQPTHNFIFYKYMIAIFHGFLPYFCFGRVFKTLNYLLSFA